MLKAILLLPECVWIVCRDDEYNYVLEGISRKGRDV